MQQLQTVESLCLVRSGLGRAAEAEVTLGWCRQQELVMSMVVAGADMGQIMEKNHSNVHCSTVISIINNSFSLDCNKKTKH